MAHPYKDRPKLVAPREGLIIAFPIHAWYQLNVFPWTAARMAKYEIRKMLQVSTRWSGVIVGPSRCPVCPCPYPDFGGSIGVMFWAFVSCYPGSWRFGIFGETFLPGRIPRHGLT